MELLDDLEEEMASRAFLYDHPATYRQAIEAAFAAIRMLMVADRSIA